MLIEEAYMPNIMLEVCSMNEKAENLFIDLTINQYVSKNANILEELC